MTLSLQFPQNFIANLQKTIQIAKQTATVPPYTELDEMDQQILDVSKQINDGAGIAYEAFIGTSHHHDAFKFAQQTWGIWVWITPG